MLWGFDGYFFSPKGWIYTFLDSFRQIVSAFRQGNIRSEGLSGLAEIIEQAHNRTGVQMKATSFLV